MIGIRRPGGRREVWPPDPANRSHRSGGAGLYLKLAAARGFVGLATSLLRMTERAYRAGYLDLAQVEYCVRVSAKLRGHACRLIGTKARNAPSSSASGRTASNLGPPGTDLKLPAVTSLSHISCGVSAVRFARSAPENITLLLTSRLR
jgi:hypothetical protein